MSFSVRRLLPILSSLIASLALVSLPATADQDIREALKQQQDMIQQLLENQRNQAAEIEQLKAQLANQPSVVGSTDDSAMDASYDLEPDIPVQEQTGLAATTPVNVMPGDAKFSVGGHINRVINFADDGANTDTYHLDSGSVPTLSYLKAYLPASEDLTVGGHIEYALQHNAANSTSQENNPGFTTSARNFEMTLDSKRYGKLWFGRGLMSSFLAAELDKSQTWRYNIISPGNTFGGLKFVNENDGSLNDLTVGAVFIDAEAFNRKDRVRYDSPIFGGFKLSGSYGTADANDLALRWNGGLLGLEVTAAISAQNNPVEGRVSDRLDGGVALYHAGTGLSFTAAGVNQEYKQSFYKSFGRSDGDNSGYTLRLGWRRNWFSLGETRMALDFSQSDDVLYKDDDAQSSSFFISQHIEAWSLEPYFGYRYYDYDTGPNANGLGLEKIQVWSLGARMALDLTVQ